MAQTLIENRSEPPRGWLVYHSNRIDGTANWVVKRHDNPVVTFPDFAASIDAVAFCWAMQDMADARQAPTRDLSAVDAFADVMREKLRENDHKGDWKKEPIAWLVGKLREEVGELIHEVTRRDVDPRLVAREAADVSNVAMMLADNTGGLGDPWAKTGRQRGEPVRCFGIGPRGERCAMYAGHAGGCCSPQCLEMVADRRCEREAGHDGRWVARNAELEARLARIRETADGRRPHAEDGDE
jgi:NTP pyrophosphatase (non-canonical NTP hydrolase)